MEKISQSVVKADHAPKIEGRSVYVGDYVTAKDGRPILTGKLLHSKFARAKVLSVEVPELPEGYFYVDAKDVPGDNNVNIILDDTPVYCRETVEYIGDPIAMVVGPDEKEVDRILSEIKVNYEELEPMLDLRKADHAFFDYEFGHGDMEKAFAEADKIYEEEFETGYILNSMLVPHLSSAQALLATGVADFETIDKTWELATGAPAGPFKILDIVGLETAYNINQMKPDAQVKGSVTNRIGKLLKEKIDKGETGVNAGVGFYDYRK